MSQSLVYVTAKDRDEALSIARVLVDLHLVACATVLGGATSVFWWEGKRQESDEAVLLAKAPQKNVSAVVAKVLEIHSYSCPCVVALPITGGNPAFLDWIDATAGGK